VASFPLFHKELEKTLLFTFKKIVIQTLTLSFFETLINKGFPKCV